MPDNSLVLSNCSQVLTMTGDGLGMVENATVRVEDGRVVEVAPAANAGTVPRSAQPGDSPSRSQEIDCRNCVVMPGLVDPHTHLVFGGWRAEEFEMRLAGRTYKEIAQAGGGILSTVKATRAASEDELFASALARLQEMTAWGTTTVEVKSGYGLDTETELKLLRVARRLDEEELATVVPTLLGAHSVPEGSDTSDYVRLLTDEMIPAVAAAGLAKFCDVFCENFVFNAAESTRVLEAGRKHGLVPTIHADEIEPSGGAEVAARVGAASASHLLQPSDAGLRAMAASGVVAVLLPGTCFFLREAHRSPVARMRELGITMAVATDFNPGSCTLLAQPLAAQFACVYYGLTVVEALRGITVNAARALRLEAGTIEPGRWADLVVTDVPDYRHLVYRLGHNPVRFTIRRGRFTCR
ncbi:imidazolonepropionase [candidate division WOR-3 bacterium]|nr:imidazolonepropionase [candidate division WOR-3 bacterium]